MTGDSFTRRADVARWVLDQHRPKLYGRRDGPRGRGRVDATRSSTEDPKRGNYPVVGAPWTFVTPVKPTPTPAPALDEHRTTILQGLGAKAGVSA